MPMMGTPCDVPLPRNVNEKAMIKSTPRILGSRRSGREPFQSLAFCFPDGAGGGFGWGFGNAARQLKG